MDNELNELINAWKTCNTGTKQQNQQQAFNYIENFKQNSSNILECGFKILNNNNIEPELIHFGAQLITHAIKFKWNNLNLDQKILIKNSLFALIENLDDNSLILKLNYLKTNVCLTFLELIKREWPQNWLTLLDELYQISRKSFQHLNLILNLFKLMADEFVLNNINLPVSRRKDINQYLNANMQQIFDFFVNTLESSYQLYIKQKQEINENHIIVSLLQSCLDCLSYYVDWIQIHIVLSRNALLIDLVLNLLNDQYVCIQAANCLLVVVSRRGQLNDRKPLLGLFNSTSLNQIFDCIKLSLTSCGQNKNYKKLLKYLLQILIEMGMQLCALWTDSTFVKPNEINIYLCAIYEFTINESKMLSFEAIQLWNSFLANNSIKNDSTIGQFIQNLANNLTNSYILYKVTSCRQLTSIYDEFDSDEELLKFFHKYRAELAKLIRQSSQLYIRPYVDAALTWTVKIINETSTSNNDPNVLAQGYNTTSFLYLSWDALIFLWSNLMLVINKQIKSKKLTPDLLALKDNLLQMLNFSINFKSINANFTSYNLSLLSSLLVLCETSAENMDLMLKITLEKLFEGFNTFKQITDSTVDEHFNAQSTPNTPTSTIYSTKSLKMKCILNVRRHCAAMILNICRNYTKNIKQFFDFIYLNINNLLNETLTTEPATKTTTIVAIESNKVLTQMEQIIFIETLIYCSNEFNSFEMQTQFLVQNLTSIKDFFFFNKEFIASIENINYFTLFIGLIDPHTISTAEFAGLTKDVCLVNRKQIFYSVNALFGVLKCIQVPELSDTTTNDEKKQLIQNGYLDQSTNKIHNPAYAFYIQLFEHLIKLLKCFNMLHMDGLKDRFSNEYKNCLKMSDAMKTLSLGMQQQAGTYDAKHIDVSELTAGSSYESDKLLMFIYNTYDTLNQLISLYFFKFKNEFLLVPVNDANTEFAYKLGEAFFTCFNELPDYRMRAVIRYILRSILESGVMCTPEQIKSELFIVKLNQLILEYFLPSILIRINEKNKYFKQLNDDLQQQQQQQQHDDASSAELTEKQIDEQIIDENQFTAMCRDFVDLMKLFFNFNTGVAVTQSNKVDVENICDDIDENIEVGENIGPVSTSPMSELSVYLLNNSQIIYQSVLLIIFEGLCWNDSFCCTRLARLAHILIETFPVRTQNEPAVDNQQLTLFLNEQISSQFFSSCLNALQIHGEHNDISNGLINLAFLIYDKFPLSCHELFNKVLIKIPNLSKKIYDDLVYKYKQTFTTNVDKHKKEKKDLFKKILMPVVGKNVGQLYKNEIIIRNLPQLISQVPSNRKRFQQQQHNNEFFEDCENSGEGLSICNLFDR
jgi:exportin-5